MNAPSTHLNTRKGLFLVFASALMSSVCVGVEGFISGSPLVRTNLLTQRLSLSSTPTALNVWWFGGAESSEINQDDDSCELVAVRIDRTSANSRKIAGSITVPTPLNDVWAILTDYDRLAIHVPNLVESKIVSRPGRGEQGDGSYRCKLFQKGAQKIVGFEFGASVTMEMTEKIVVAADADGNAGASRGQERMIGFKCVDSFFFSEFDGDWTARERVSETGEVETELTYVVDVRPKGPVPVAALEWRIREDVPTNLRAVKKAATEVGFEGVMASRKRLNPGRSVSSRSAPVSRSQTQTSAIKRATIRQRNGSTPVPVRNRSNRRMEQPVIARNKASGAQKVASPVAAMDQSRGNILRAAVRKPRSTAQPPATKRTQPLPFKVTWEADETMAAYLRE